MIAKRPPFHPGRCLVSARIRSAKGVGGLRLVRVGDFPAESLEGEELQASVNGDVIEIMLERGELPLLGPRAWRDLLAERQQLLRRVRELERKLADRRVISQAVCHLMYQSGLGEAAAYRLLQKRSMDRRQPLVKVAEEILTHLGPDG